MITKSNIHRIVSLMIMALALSSCVEKIDLKLDEDEVTRLIVQGSVTDADSIQTVILKLTAPYDSDLPCPPATGALVKIIEGVNVYTLSETAAGVYQTDALRGEVGKTYRLSLEYEGEIYEASSTMQAGFVIDSISLKIFPFGQPAEKPHYHILVYGQEDPTPDQFYLFQYAIDGEWNNNPVSWGYYIDFISNGSYLDGEPIMIFETYLEEIELQLRSVSLEEEYIWFLDKCIWNVMPNMFFSPPPANVKGNIVGAMGYFSASSVHHSKSVKVKKSDYFGN